MTYNQPQPLLRHGQNLFKINAMIGGINKGDFYRVTLLVDTGSSMTILPVKILEDLGYNLNNPQSKQTIVTGKGTTPPIPIIQIAWFNCIGQLLKNFEVMAYNIPAVLRVDGLLGMNFLISCQSVISVATAKIYCQNIIKS
ncbi:MAG: peptidase A2A [Microcystis aeruginosa G13-12]|jgi:aspartyl protease family protein|nr:peptidase A2A [Microcystis aeruginosa G13-07]NCS18253.1 peptidase A2A [Microcystis aeruginosa G13-12]NCT52612.1 peptidase A2A [Microcystis aeruginosa G13-03]NCT61789.1 peptidase A2A [Microcystis aeruginosa G13-01]